MRVIAVSNIFTVSNQFQDSTMEIVYSEPADAWGFNYSENPGFEQKCRIGVELVNPRTFRKGKTYRQSNGEYRRGTTFIDKQYKLRTEYFDEATHDIMAIALSHKYCTLNGKSIFLEEDYEIEQNDEPGFVDLVSPASAIVTEQGFNKQNYLC
jgi:hypothetical protein